MIFLVNSKYWIFDYYHKKAFRLEILYKYLFCLFLCFSSGLFMTFLFDLKAILWKVCSMFIVWLKLSTWTFRNCILGTIIELWLTSNNHVSDIHKHHIHHVSHQLKAKSAGRAKHQVPNSFRASVTKETHYTLLARMEDPDSSLDVVSEIFTVETFIRIICGWLS